jgi:UDP-2,4-diacetamido-2,4,6-trideoxy-beta-L-altropyranose hydrolase
VIAAFRTDASLSIGSGHVMRCLTLAGALRERAGAQCHFIGRGGDGDLLALVRSQGHAAHALPPADPGDAAAEVLAALRPDWLVVDHYGIDARWERRARTSCRRILVIDDLADRPHDCDLLLDQNVYADADATQRYGGLVPPHCRVLVGAAHALLRPEFAAAGAAPRARSFDPVRRLHVFFGGSDPTGDTLRTLDCLAREDFSRLQVDVVIGAQNPQRAQVMAAADGRPNLRVSVQVADMARHLAEADLAIGACGSAALERCRLALPTLTLVTADNQRELAEGLARRGAILPLGPTADLDGERLAASLADALASPDRLREVSRASLALFEGAGDGAAELAALMAAMAKTPA